MTPHRVPCALGALTLALGAGCSVALRYPDRGPEGSVAACHDGLDQDADGAFDCADPDCDGHCVEAGPALCRDGRDNDHDGLLDVHDARCWREHVLAVAPSCSSVPGTSLGEDVVDWMLTPPVPPTEIVLASGDTTTALVLSGSARWVSDQTLTGDLDGTQISVELVLGARTGSSRIGLVPASQIADPRGESRAGMFVGFASELVELVVAGTRVHSVAASGPSLTVTATIHEGRVVLGGAWAGEHPTGWTLAEAFGATTTHEPLRLVIEALDAPAAEPWQILSLAVTRAPADPCDVGVPQLEEPGLALARLATGELCALAGVTEPGSAGRVTALRGWRSTDEGETWVPAGEPIAGPAAAYGAAVLDTVPSGVAGAVVSLRGRDLEDEAGDVWLIESADCASWSLAPTGIGPQLPTNVSGRSLGMLRHGVGEVALLLYYPSFGGPLRFGAASAAGPYHPLLDRPLDVPSVDPGRGVRFVAWGNDELLLGTTARGVELFVRAETGWSPLVEPLVRASAEPGTFDEEAAVAIGLSVERTPEGVHLFVLHDGGPQGTCPDCTFPVAVTSSRIAATE